MSKKKQQDKTEKKCKNCLCYGSEKVGECVFVHAKKKADDGCASGFINAIR